MNTANQIANLVPPLEEVRQSLQQLNTDLKMSEESLRAQDFSDLDRLLLLKGEGYARAFYIVFDNDYKNWVVTIVWIVKEHDTVSKSVLDTWTALCQLGTGRVEQHVEFAYCDYVIDSEFADRYSANHWESALVLL